MKIYHFSGQYQAENGTQFFYGKIMLERAPSTAKEVDDFFKSIAKLTEQPEEKVVINSISLLNP